MFFQDLFLGKPLGLLSLLDEQSNFPQATDTSLVTKFNETFKKKKGVFITSKGSASGTFAIQHYAGKVCHKIYDNTTRMIINIIILRLFNIVLYC